MASQLWHRQGAALWDAFQPFEIPLLDVPHHITATNQVRTQLGTDLGGHDEKLIMCRLAERNSPCAGTRYATPLINQAEIP
jgi:hypothetical protein